MKNTQSPILEHRLSSIIEFTKDSIIIINHKGEIVLWNNASTALFGFTATEVMGSKIHIIIPKEMRSLHDAEMAIFLAAGEKKIIGRTVQINGQKKDGSIFPIELSLSSWEESNEIFFCGIIRDISDRKKKDREIIDLRGIIDSSPSCLKLVSKKGELLMMNSVGLGLIECENFAIVDKVSVYEIVHDQDRDSFIKFNEFICDGGKGSLIFKIVGLKGTERIMETFARAHKLESGEIAHLAITNEITERIKAERELQQKDLKLEEAKRLSVIGEFAAGIAHEVNNPLAIIHSKAQLLELQLNQLGIENTEKVKLIQSSLNSIKQTVIHTSDLIKNLKTFSSKANFENLEVIRLKEVIDMALKISQKRCSNAGIKIIMGVDPNIKLNCSITGLSQVILNLLSNSIDALETLEEKWIQIETNVSDKVLKIIITDSGNGIPAKIVKKITLPFFSTKDTGKGTGLGLSISVKSIEKMNGYFYYNVNAKNTQFIIEFKSFEI
ncbi:MAG: PAS domain S-box protein [Flavobacteriales bacterium]|nr:PAS domain S-box protein [Flavobacteriales bacterium]